MGTLGRTYLFYFPPQVVRVPETDQLDQNPSLRISGIGQHKIGHHDRISEQQHLAFARQVPVPSFVPNLLLKLTGKICFEPAVELA